MTVVRSLATPRTDTIAPVTVESWGNVPPGMPVHHHCVVAVEWAADPRYWTDASTATPDLVAWQPDDAVSWVRDQLTAYREEAEAGRDQPLIDADLAAYDDPPKSDLPHLWDRLRATLRMGRWAMEPYQLGFRRKLVMQILCFADQGQPSGINGKRYTVCRQHARPADQPYLGLTEDQEEHFTRYGSLYVAT